MRKLTSHLCFMLCFTALLLVGCEYLPLSLPTTEPTLTPTQIIQPSSTFIVTPKVEMPSGPSSPIVLSHIPANGQEVLPDTEIALQFDQPMDRESVVAAFHLYPPTDGDLTWRDDATLIFRPKALTSAARYRVTLASEARSSTGLPLATEVAFAFSIATPLEITQISPSAIAPDVRADAPLWLAFNHAVVSTDCVGQFAKADCPALPLTFAPAVLGDGLWVNTSLYRFDPLPGWAAGITYQVLLDANVRSVDGLELTAAVESSFTTALPFVLATFPDNNTSNVSLNTEIRVHFNTPMDQEITASVFSVRTASDEIVPGTVMWEGGGAQLLFTPTQALALATHYIVQIGERARAITSAPLQNPQSFIFKTSPYPSVSAFTPSSNAESDVLAPVSIAFAGEIDPYTLAGQINITPFSETNRLHTHFETTTNLYHLSWDKQPQTEYCIMVAAGVTDVYGNALENPQTSCFTTGDYDPFIDLAADVTALTLDATTEPTAYFLVRNLERVDFTLLSLNEASFIQSPRDVTGDVQREWTARFAPPLNQTTVEPVILTRRGNPLPTGYYYLMWETPNWGARGVYIAVVDRHITLKLAPTQALVWMTDLQTGVPITRTAVRLMDQEGVLIAAGTTDDAGLANIPIGQRENLWDKVAAIVGEPGAAGFGLAVSGGAADVVPWNFDIDADYGPDVPFQIFLHTDRSLYHPGQLVNFGGLLRSADDVAYTLPPDNTTLWLSLHNALGEVVYSRTVSLTGGGTFEDAILLSDATPTGEYQLLAQLTGEPPLRLQSVGLSIVDYEPPELDVVVLADADDYVNGDTVQALVLADYPYGVPVSNAQVQWRVFAAPDEAVNPTQIAVAGQVIAEGTGAADATGQFLLDFSADLAALPAFESTPQRWTIEVTVFNRLGVTARALSTFFVHPAQVAVTVHLERHAIEPGTKVPIRVQTQDWQHAPIADQVLTVMLASRQWYKVVPTNPLAVPTWAYTDTLVSTNEINADATGAAETSIRPTRGGIYVVRVETQDAEGRVVSAEATLWVSDDEVLVAPTAENRLLPVAAKDVYQVDDVAHILLPTPFKGPYQVLMTVEREDILDVTLFDFDSPNPLIELPIVDAYTPNVYVSFVATQAITDTHPVPEARSGYVLLRVNPTAQILSLTLSSDQTAAYEPGATATLTIRAADADGVPLDATVSLVVVDKAVSEMRQFHVPTIVDIFYGVQPLRVVMGDSLLVLLDRLSQQLERLALTAERWVAEATGENLAREGVAEPLIDVQHAFPDATLLWHSTLQTDASGETQVDLELPHILTTWVAHAYAVTEDSKVGIAQTELQVQQVLGLHPVTPHFFVAGDRPQIAAIVHNYSDQDLDVAVEVHLDGAGVVGDALHRVAVPAGRQIRIAWTLDIPLTADATVDVAFSAVAGQYRTVTQVQSNVGAVGIPVYRYITPSAMKTAGTLNTAERRALSLFVPAHTSAGSHLVLQVDTSLLSVLSAGLDYVTHAPYATTDTLVNRFLPSLVAERVPSLSTGDALPASIFDSVERLYARQNPDGGWGWWQDESDLPLTAYVVLGLVQARESGYEVRADVLAPALFYVQETLRASLQGGTRQAYHAFALYALSKADYAWPDGAVAALYTSRDSLATLGQAYLALALGQVDKSDTRIATLLENLREDVQHTVSGSHWEASVAQYGETDILATAVAVEAFAQYAPADVLLPSAITWLLGERQLDHWSTHYETAWVVMALTTYAQTTEMMADYAWSMTLNGIPLVEKVSADASSQRLYIPLDDPGAFSLLRGEVNILEITRDDGPGPLYYTLQLALTVPADEVRPESRGLLIRREFCALSHTDSATPSVCEPIRRVPLGDDLEVRLTLIVPQTRYFVTLEDMYPAAFEPASTALLVDPVIVTSHLTNTEEIGPQHTWWWGNPFDHWLLRDDRAVFFARELFAGTYQVRYTLRAIQPGVYHALPATVKQTYFPEVWGHSSGGVIEVLPPFP